MKSGKSIIRAAQNKGSVSHANSKITAATGANSKPMKPMSVESTKKNYGGCGCKFDCGCK